MPPVVSATCWRVASSSWLWTLKPSISSVAPGRAADADRVDPHPAVGGGLGGLERVRVLVVLAVGQQHDRGRGVGALRDRWQVDARRGRAVGVVAGGRARLGGRDRRQRLARCRCRSRFPRCGVRRSMAARTWVGSSVGSWTEKPLSLNATTPIWTVAGCLATNVRAAALAASIRVGARSSAAMLPDTSKARMTMPSKRGTLTTLCGRARATTRIVKSDQGVRGDDAAADDARGGPVRTRRTASGAVGSRPAPATALHREVEGDTERDQHEQQQHDRPDERHRPYLARRRRRFAMRTMARTRSSSVDSATSSTPACMKASRRVVSRRSAASRNRRRKPLSWVST